MPDPFPAEPPLPAEPPEPTVSDSPRQGPSLPAWVLSVLVHAAVLTSLVLVLDRAPQGTGDDPDRPVGIALVHRTPDRTEYVTEPDVAVSEESEESASAPADAAAEAIDAATETPPAVDLEGLLSQLTDAPTPTDGGAGGAIEASDADGGESVRLGDGGSEKVTTTIFGISGSGSRFVYVFDRSDSMNGFGGRPLRAAKSELLRSLRTLGPQQQFQIVFYNHRPQPFRAVGQAPGLLRGEDHMRQRAENYVRAMEAFGGTNHFDALKLALQMGPDVIFFMTDARIPRLTRRELGEVRNLALRSGTTIHAIELGVDASEPTDTFLRELAHENGGQYRYLNAGALDGAPSSAVAGEASDDEEEAL